jgi:ATP-dependent helicase/nuclease subunit A
MSMRRLPPSETLERQRRASDPSLSAWVSANAGSGKTTVLTRRVIRLLIDGVPPSAILCLTFTKAAAANMQNRIFKQLARWSALDDTALAAEIEDLSGRPMERAALARARRLFAAAVETPGGLKVLTIHAFCERVLHLFPFEANVPAQFAVLEERAASELLDAVRQSVVMEANAHPDGELGKAFSRIVEDAGKDAFDDLLSELAARRDAVRALLKAGPAGEAVDRVRRLLLLAPHESVAAIEQDLDEGCIPEEDWPTLATALQACGQDTMTKLGAGFAAAALAPQAGRRGAYRKLFLTEKGEPRSAGKFLTKPFCVACPDLADVLQGELGRIGGLLERRKVAACFERTAALMTLAVALLETYERRKRRIAALDFDDLVTKTLELLRRAGAEWVLYKLDRGIDHILVDEAQDTSPKQWQIVDLLASEFTAGEGARSGVKRTIFAVGDEKQSIFSFQGAAPAEFARMRGEFRRRLTAAGEAFEAIDLKHSFRSTMDVLSAVDAVFADPGARRGLSSDDVATIHETVRLGDPGGVEVWPVVRHQPTVEIEAWDAPFDETPNTSPVARAAKRIASSVAALIRDGDRRTGARYGAGDVMVLVRSRNALFEAVIRALKRENVPVAGADRLVLMDHIAVMDLVALARFTLLPADDLTLATVLKTPLIGLDDDHLIELAPGRRGSLWEALRERARSDPAFRNAHDRLRAWIDEAGFKTPFAFFAGVLARDGGRRAFLARLGHEAADALDEFLGAAADYERQATPSLEGFLAWIEAARSEIKRDMDVARGEVRVMTVHGAKGLEAKVVILADTCSAPDGRHDPKLFTVADDVAAGTAPLVVWSTGRAMDPPCVSKARDAIRADARAEHRRLLYVALTRAQDRLIVTGHEASKARPEDSWYDMIEPTLRRDGARVEPMPDGDGERLVWERSPRLPVAQTEAPGSEAPCVEPAWLRRPAPEEAVVAAPIRPSGQDGHEADRVARGPGAAADRGSLVHQLLQALPGLAPSERKRAARRYIERAGAGLAGESEGLLSEVLALLDDPSVAPVFAHGSRAEVPLVGRIVREGRPDLLVSGRIDRLRVGEDEVLIVDFKTSRSVPRALDDVPADYVRQLALYACLLARLYPERPIRAAIIWTAEPRVMEVPHAVLHAALEDLA